MQTTVLVVGGGATGVGVARGLAMRGVAVTLVERGGLASGTSGRSRGLLHSGARYAEADALGAQECIRENESLRDIAGDAVRDTGGLFVSLEDDDADYFAEKPAACHDHGIPAEDTRGGSRGISRGFFLLDHADDGVDNFASIVGGKLTTYRMMAEATADHVCERLGVDASSTTAEETLPGADDPATLNRLVERYDARSPADEDVLAAGESE